MRVTVLTTDTLHHAYFVRELRARGYDVLTVIETKSLKAPFETAHPYEAEREIFESQLWFGGEKVKLKDARDTICVESINDPQVIEILQRESSVLNVVFGTGRIEQSIISASRCKLLNLHGGDPRAYRGLDSVLWAIYHGEFVELKTCLHTVNAKLDDGDIVGLQPLTLGKDMKLHQLRAENARVCVELVNAALLDIARGSEIALVRQQQMGRYYSFMPTVLKELCVKKFERFTARLS